MTTTPILLGDLLKMMLHLAASVEICKSLHFLPREGGVANDTLHPGMMALEHSALPFLSGSSIGRKQLASYSYLYVQDKSLSHV